MSNDYKEYAIEGMLGEDAENVEEMINEWFFEGWDDPKNLKYLPDDEVEEYEKTFEWDCYDFCKIEFEMMVEFKIKDEWLPLIDNVFPTEDKRIDYFLRNNHAYALILHIVRQQLKVAFKDKVFDDVQHDAEILERKVDLLNRLNESRKSDVLKKLDKKIAPFIKKKPTKPIGSSPLLIKRDHEIRAKYDDLVGRIVEVDGMKLVTDAENVQKKLGKEYNLEPDTIRKIYYSYGKTPKTPRD